MAETHLPPSRIPVWGWILLLLALAMFVGLLTAVVRDHERVGRLALGPGAAPAPVSAPLATG